MERNVNHKDIRWWFWFVILIFITVALLGWVPSYYIVIIISVMHFVFFLLQEKGISAFPVQIRFVYLAFTLLGLWPNVRFYIYLILFLGTLMVVFWGRCSIAMVLKRMPWNKGREVRLN